MSNPFSDFCGKMQQRLTFISRGLLHGDEVSCLGCNYLLLTLDGTFGTVTKAAIRLLMPPPKPLPMPPPPSSSPLPWIRNLERPLFNLIGSALSGKVMTARNSLSRSRRNRVLIKHLSVCTALFDHRFGD